MDTFDVVVVGGLGHIGLPLAIVFADRGLRVCAYDINQAHADVVRQGKLPFIEYEAEPVLQRVLANGNLSISLDMAVVGQARHVIVCIGTPVDEYFSPKTAQFLQVFAQLQQVLRPGQNLIVRSSIYPGITERMFAQLGGEPWLLSYCPERIVQGYAMQELPKLPQIVAGMTPEAARLSADLFRHITPHIVETTVREAELVKLFANAWRYIKFAVANQFYMLCNQNGVDYHRVRHAMREGYERAMDVPGAGFAAGPCLLKDTMQLASFSGNQFLLGHSAMMINEGLPNFLVAQLQQEMDLNGKVVGILGMAFKSDIDDPRDSLSFKLKKVLQFAGATVLCSDEYLHDARFVRKEEVLETCEVIFLAVPHRAYRNLKPPRTTRVVDLWGWLDVAEPERA